MPQLQSLRLVLHQAACGASLSALLESPALGKLRVIDCHTVRDCGLATIAQLTRWAGGQAAAAAA